jgi:hypothetical protein
MLRLIFMSNFRRFQTARAIVTMDGAGTTLSPRVLGLCLLRRLAQAQIKFGCVAVLRKGREKAEYPRRFEIQSTVAERKQ